LKKAFIRGTILQFAVLFGLWLVLSERFDIFHVSIGFFCAVLSTLIHVKINRHLYYRHEIAKEHALKIPRLFLYVPWLIWQIIVASLQVAYLVLHPKTPIRPSLVSFKTRLPNVAAKVILANSITLTPGTLTIQISGDAFLVHSLTDASYTGIVDGSLPLQVAKLYERKPSAVISETRILKTTKGL